MRVRDWVRHRAGELQKTKGWKMLNFERTMEEQKKKRSQSGRRTPAELRTGGEQAKHEAGRNPGFSAP